MGIDGLGYKAYGATLYGMDKTLGYMGTSPKGDADKTDAVSKVVKNPGESDEKKVGRKSSPAECETCKERKYQDGSDEMVSFKSAAHISPEAAASKVRAHEQEHVANAYKKAEKGNGRVLSANVSLKTAICPECGRTYCAGGLTTTKIKYSNEKNPYQQNAKSADATALRGMNVDLAV